MKLSGRAWDLSLSLPPPTLSLRQSRKIRWKKVTYEGRALGRWWQQQHSFLISLNPSIKTDRIREQNQKFTIYIYKETKCIKGILRKPKPQACEEKPPTALRPAWYSICVRESRGSEVPENKRTKQPTGIHWKGLFENSIWKVGGPLPNPTAGDGKGSTAVS